MPTSRRIATATIILSLALALVGCHGTSGKADPQTEGNNQPVEQQSQTEDDAKAKQGAEAKKDAETKEDATVDTHTVATLFDEDDGNVALIRDDWEIDSYTSVDKLAKDMIAGKVNIALVAPDASAALYNATGGALMAFDAVLDEYGDCVAVTVVRNSFFSSNPDAVIEGINRHQELVSSTLGEDCFVRGSAMQRIVSDAITEAYVENPSSVGGSLPPDNFYFLG